MRLHVVRSRMIMMMGSLLLTVTVGAGCSGQKVETKSSNELPRYTIRSLALLPFTSIATPQVRDQDDFLAPAPSGSRRSDISLAIPSDVEPRARQTVIVPAVAAETVTQMFWKGLQERKGLQIVSPREATAALPLDNNELDGARLEQAAAAIARRLNVDAVLTGLVTMYQERVGSRLGANPPAAVGFEVKVVAADGQVLWVGDYYERQRPMNEDLMGFLQRWSFVTADELARYGVGEILKEFPFGTGGEK